MAKYTLNKIIQAPVSKLWKTMLTLKTYEEWAAAFTEGSTFLGEWSNVGNEMKFFGTDGTGIISKVTEYTINETITLQVVGLLGPKNEEDRVSDSAKQWIGSYEKYSLRKMSDESTEIIIEQEVIDEYADMMKAGWEKGLNKLKKIAERSDKTITVRTVVAADIHKCWLTYTDPLHIKEWNFADPSWECPSVFNDLKIGGTYKVRMQESANPENGFDFLAVYDEIIEDSLIKYTFDGRNTEINFEVTKDFSTPEKILSAVTITFLQEEENSRALQETGWASILENYKRYTESLQ